MKIYEQPILGVTQEEQNARFFRISFKAPFTTNNDEVGKNPWDYPKVSIPNPTHINLNNTAKRYSPVGRCIYCGSLSFRHNSNLPLSDEHIIAEGLGGKLILPKASCEACAKITCNIEGAILRTLFLAPRGQLKIRGKKRKRNTEGYPLITTVGGKDVVINMPLNEHPTILLLLTFHAPRLTGIGGIAGIWVHTFGTPEIAYKRGANEIASPGFDTVRFCQMLAKIAHGYAIAEIGLANFKPIQNEFILRQFARAEQYPSCYDFVGGDPRCCAPSDDLHTIGHTIVLMGEKQIVVVFIRLFANLGAPIYSVIVGEMLG